MKLHGVGVSRPRLRTRVWLELVFILVTSFYFPRDNGLMSSVHPTNVASQQTYGIATYNLVSTYQDYKIRQLETFFIHKGYDIIILTETANQPLTWSLFNYWNNVSSEGTRGVGLLWRKDVPLRNLRLHPTGRLIAASLYNLWLVGVYAPSGTASRNSRETLFQQDLPQWLDELQAPQYIVLGDFNAVTRKEDSSSPTAVSPAYKSLMAQWDFVDLWLHFNPGRLGPTYFYTEGASRLDAIWVSIIIINQFRKITYERHALSDHTIVATSPASNVQIL